MVINQVLCFAKYTRVIFQGVVKLQLLTSGEFKLKRWWCQIGTSGTHEVSVNTRIES